MDKETLKKQNKAMFDALRRIENQPNYGTVDGIMSSYAKEAIKECRRIEKEYKQKHAITENKK